MGQFGKEIQSNQISGWSTYYLDYKGLKKIIGALQSSYSATADISGGPLRPGDLFSAPEPFNLQDTLPPDATAPLGPTNTALDDDRGPVFQAHKAAFFFKLERELEKVRWP